MNEARLRLCAIVLCGSSVWHTSIAFSSDHCKATKPVTCENSSDLSWANGFPDSIKRFLGSQKVGYFGPDRSLSEQALNGLHGPPDDRQELSAGLFLFAACPAHNCGGQAAAVILDSRGRVKAVGFSSFHCALHCDFSHRYLDFYVKENPEKPRMVEFLSAWGVNERNQSLLTDKAMDEGIMERTVTHSIP